MIACRWLLDVAAACVMPWRAVRTIRGQQEGIMWLIRTLADEVGASARPKPRHLHVVR